MTLEGFHPDRFAHHSPTLVAGKRLRHSVRELIAAAKQAW